jgi:hypothetical protein
MKFINEKLYSLYDQYYPDHTNTCRSFKLNGINKYYAA